MPIRKTHILLIEDNQGDIRLIREFLREADPWKYQLTVGETLSDGISFLQNKAFDVVLSDLGLPDSKGFATFERLNQACSSLPILVLTSSQDEELGRNAVSLGAQDFLDKQDLSAQILTRAITYAIERKQMLRRLEEAQELAKFGNWDIDVSDHSFQASSQVFRIFGLPEGKTFSSFDTYLSYVHPDDQGKLEEAMNKSYREAGGFEKDHRIVLPDQEIKHLVLQCQSKTSEFGQLLSIRGTIQDVTDRKRVEILLREKELADKATKLRQEFLAKTSHEIRTPLNPILLLTDMLLKTDLNQEQQEHLNAIRSGGETLLAVVNDILDLSKIEAGKIDFNRHEFDIRKVFTSIKDMMEGHAQARGLDLYMEVEEDVPKIMIGDTVRLTQIILNLVGNGIKFTQHGYVKISARKRSTLSNSAVIEFKIEDSGIGIPTDKLKIIFESFQQVDSDVNRRSGGTGLGLTIVRQLVLLQGGSIQVTSEEGRGSCFVFDLEFLVSTEDNSTSKKEEEVDKTRLKGVKVLLVEDNLLNQIVTKKLLTDWGIDLDIAHNGRDGVEKVQKGDYQLVLMDVQMPEMDGYEATLYIRNQIQAPKCHIPIIALTANAFTGSDDECLKVGMDDYVSKPIPIKTLYSKLVQYIQPPCPQEDVQPDQEKIVHKQGAKPNGISLEPIDMHRNYVDLTYLEEVCSGDKNIIRKIIGQYIKTSPEMLQKVEEQFQTGDYASLAKTAHKLKSNIQILKIEQIEETIKKIEEIARHQINLDKLDHLVSELRQGINGSVTELQQTLDTL